MVDPVRDPESPWNLGLSSSASGGGACWGSPASRPPFLHCGPGGVSPELRSHPPRSDNKLRSAANRVLGKPSQSHWICPEAHPLLTPLERGGHCLLCSHVEPAVRILPRSVQRTRQPPGSPRLPITCAPGHVLTVTPHSSFWRSLRNAQL